MAPSWLRHDALFDAEQAAFDALSEHRFYGMTAPYGINHGTRQAMPLHDYYAIMRRWHISDGKKQVPRVADFVKKRLKNPPFRCIKASFIFVNMQKMQIPYAPFDAKGHQTRRHFFYFESCVCQKKRKVLS